MRNSRVKCYQVIGRRDASTKPHFWLRSEVKPFEQRTLLLPQHVKELTNAGFKISVEKCPQRCVPIEEYKKIPNVQIVEAGSWVDAPRDAVIVGLKELPDADFPLVHSHIFFAHVFKGQYDAPKLLGRFNRGQGRLYDLEYLLGADGRRVAAFGFSAGMAGAAIGALVWAWRRKGRKEPYPAISDFTRSYKQLTEDIKKDLASRRPRVIIVGGKGRVASGATAMCESIGAEVVIWDHEDTRDKRGPFLELLGADIFINAILLSADDNFVFLDRATLNQSLKQPGRKLDTIVDISCDINNPKNPIPLHKELTSFQSPSLRIDALGVDVIQIDHLPSLVPYESSEDFTGQLLPHLLQFNETDVWGNALKLFDTKRQLYRE